MKKVCTICGGTGSSAVLKSLEFFSELDITAIVSMADDGGSTGILCRELGVSPVGDARQCVGALSGAPFVMQRAINYRFEKGLFKGHCVGNIFLAALELITGNFETALEEMGRLFHIRGRIVPMTIQKVQLIMALRNGKILRGEKNIYSSREVHQGVERLFLVPSSPANPRAVRALLQADMIIIGPGGWYTSILAILLVDEIRHAVLKSPAKKAFVVNLVNRQTKNFTVSDYIVALKDFIGCDIFDYIIINNQRPEEDLLQVYHQEGGLVENDFGFSSRAIEAPLLGELKEKQGGDFLTRSRVRHNPESLAAIWAHFFPLKE